MLWRRAAILEAPISPSPKERVEHDATSQASPSIVSDGSSSLLSHSHGSSLGEAQAMRSLVVVLGADLLGLDVDGDREAKRTVKDPELWVSGLVDEDGDHVTDMR